MSLGSDHIITCQHILYQDTVNDRTPVLKQLDFNTCHPDLAMPHVQVLHLLPQSVSLQAAQKRQHEQQPPHAFDKIIFNFPHIGLSIKDQVQYHTEY